MCSQQCYVYPDKDPLTSPLEHLKHLEHQVWGRVGTPLTEVETIKPFVVRPWWQAPEIAIAETQEQALKDNYKVFAGAYGSSTTLPTQTGAALTRRLAGDSVTRRDPGAPA